MFCLVLTDGYWLHRYSVDHTFRALPSVRESDLSLCILLNWTVIKLGLFHFMKLSDDLCYTLIKVCTTSFHSIYF